MAPPVARCHRGTPVAACCTRTFPFAEPTYTVPAAITGEDCTAPPVARDHFSMRPWIPIELVTACGVYPERSGPFRNSAQSQPLVMRIAATRSVAATVRTQLEGCAFRDLPADGPMNAKAR